MNVGLTVMYLEHYIHEGMFNLHFSLTEVFLFSV